MQLFKGDENELKMIAGMSSVVDAALSEKENFLDGAYDSYGLGGVIFDSGRAPLSNAIPRDIFVSSFNAMFEGFQFAGTFESYLSVFRKVFGPDVDVTFTVPGPGKLNIDLIATNLELYNLVARRVENNAYVFDEIVDDVGDNIVVQAVKGMDSESELNSMLFEMVPNGIYTQISLTVG